MRCALFCFPVYGDVWVLLPLIEMCFFLSVFGDAFFFTKMLGFCLLLLEACSILTFLFLAGDGSRSSGLVAISP